MGNKYHKSSSLFFQSNKNRFCFLESFLDSNAHYTEMNIYSFCCCGLRHIRQLFVYDHKDDVYTMYQKSIKACEMLETLMDKIIMLKKVKKYGIHSKIYPQRTLVLIVFLHYVTYNETSHSSCIVSYVFRCIYDIFLVSYFAQDKTKVLLL